MNIHYTYYLLIFTTPYQDIAIGSSLPYYLNAIRRLWQPQDIVVLSDMHCVYVILQLYDVYVILQLYDGSEKYTTALILSDIQGPP